MLAYVVLIWAGAVALLDAGLIGVMLRWRLDHPTLADVDEVFEPSLRDAARAMRSAAGNAWGWLRENF